MKAKSELIDCNSGRATPSLRYNHAPVETKENKGYFIKDYQNNLPEDFPNSK
jgi:hypothetical protein